MKEIVEINLPDRPVLLDGAMGRELKCRDVPVPANTGDPFAVIDLRGDTRADCRNRCLKSFKISMAPDPA